MQDQVVNALGEVFARQRRVGGIPLVVHDADFPSPAEHLPAVAGQVGWQAWLKPEPSSFLNVAAALEIDVHEDVSRFFGHYYAGNIEGCFKGLFLTLLQPSCHDEQKLVTLNNASGEVQLERLGKGAIGVLAPNLATFLRQLEVC